LLTLRNEELQTACRELELASEASERKQLIYLQKNEIASAQIERENRGALDKRLAEKRRQLDALVVRAPQAGMVLARNLPALLGTYLREGEEVLFLGEPARKELRAAVSEADAQHFAARFQEPIPVRLQSRSWHQARLVRITPRASREPLHPALRADLGGPLAVKARKPDDKGRQEYELTEPRFRATLALSDSLGRAVSAGEIGQISIRPLDTTVGARLVWLATRWIRHQLDHYRSPDS
jgi:hypothetical protein